MLDKLTIMWCNRLYLIFQERRFVIIAKNINVELRKFVKDECANYFLNSDNISNYCCLENTEGYTCTYYLNLNEDSESQNNRCGYFEKNVLLMNKDFKYIYDAVFIYKEDIKEFTKNIKKRSSKKNKVE